VTLDLVPTVIEDGYTINLPVVTTVLGFLGYADNRTNRVAVYINGKQKSAVPPLPRVRKEQMASTVSVRDGQTLVLGSVVSERSETLPVLGTLPGFGPLFRSDSTNAQKRNLLIFVTPTIIDPAGNRVHVDDEMPFARERVPAQPPR
jgi:type II secretory pathway component GspD/PulD (secretin)